MLGMLPSAGASTWRRLGPGRPPYQSTRAAGSRGWLITASGGGAGVRDEASEGQDQNGCETEDDGSLLQPPFDGASSPPDCQQTSESRRYPKDHDDVANDAERPWRAGSRCHRDQDQTKSDSDRSDDVERAGSHEVLGEPHEARRRKDADSADSADTKAEHECQGVHGLLGGACGCA